MELEPTTLSDDALVALTLDGTREAFSPLLARYWPSVLRLCTRLLGQTHEAQDIAQDAALAAFIGLPSLAEPARFGAWLHAIAANLARMSLRRRRPFSLDALSSGHPVIRWPAPMPPPEEIHAARELHDAIVNALYELSPANRDVAIGYFLEGYSYAELAEVLGVPLSTVKGRIFKSRKQLQQTLALHAGASHLIAAFHRKDTAVSEQEQIEVRIAEIRTSAWSDHRVVVLQCADGRVVPIWIGRFEADAIAMHLGGRQPERPMTHDLTLRLLVPLGASIIRVVIHAIQDITFLAEITLQAGGETHVIDARPSDAIALAVRSDVPLFVSRAVYETCGIDEGQRDGLGFTITNAESIPSPFDPPLFHLLSALSNAAGFELDQPGGVVWETEPVELEGQAYTSIMLPGGNRRLLVEPQTWNAMHERIRQFTKQRQEFEALLAQRTPAASPKQP
ncbi:MAG TPA: bifunctional nuclease domain-containing protein [Roseiflexaceae bacterium]|nr:bifunctional nuclease domain-containing protein [Roseiflexaceae bacterium]